MRSRSAWSRTRSTSVNNLVSSKQGLLALTSHNIFSIQGSNEDYITAAPPPRVRPEVSRGVSPLKPIVVDNVTFYETAKTGEVRTIGYEFELDGIRTDDLTIFSRHLFENQDIVDWAYAEKPGLRRCVVVRRRQALCLTWDQAQQVWGWTRLRDRRAGQGRVRRHRAGRGPVLFPRRARDQRRYEALCRAHGLRSCGKTRPTPAISIARAPSPIPRR
jgi:hypothetical protein